MQKLVLASTSPARRKLLSEAGIEFLTIAPGVDEEALVAELNPQSATELTGLLAKAKAEAVVAEFPNSLVLGCDSALEFAGEILGKPLKPELAIERWKSMRGQSGWLHSGHHLIDTATLKAVTLVTQTKVHFASLSDGQIQRYVATGEPLNVAGAFTIDGIGGAFIERIEGDYHTVVGLSLVGLRSMVTDLGHDYQDLWR
ncbi:MAG: septum formation inhibitor Maf [Actinobacteria bacterium]|nr:septum formation inhibitor Maf [Actinomycetota bacterium]